MEEERTVIIENDDPDPDGEDVEVQRVICPKCGHYELHAPKTAEAIFADWKNYKCTVCWVADGVTRVRKTEALCAGCGQTMGKDRMHYCPQIRGKRGLYKISEKISDKDHEMKNSQLQKIEHEIEAGKQEWKFKKSKRKERLEAYEREKSNAKNLQIIADSLTKKTPEAKPKEYKGSAIRGIC